MTDGEVRAALTDLQAVALTLWGEARSEPIEGIIAVACVIRNRKRGTKYGWKKTVLRKSQFSCWAAFRGPENYERLMLLARQVVTGGVIDGISWSECLWVAEGLIDGRFRHTLPLDTRHYLTTRLFHNDPPAWSHEGRIVAVIGDHTFLAGVA